MPFSRPTLNDLIDRVSTDIASRLPGSSTALLRRSLAGVLARAEAGAVHSLYGYLEFIARQALPDTAEDEYLLRWSSIWLPNGRKQATYANGLNAVQLTGTPGSVVPAGTFLVRTDGIQFVTLEAVSVGISGVAVSVRAELPGASSNTAAGVALSLLQPVTGVRSSALVVSPGIDGGVEQESIEALRARVINRIQKPPQGGSKDDYETWALEVPGVTRAWVYPLQMGPGTVTVIVADDSAVTAPIPSAATVAAAQAYISDDSRKPVTAEVFVVAPTVLTVNVSIQLSPNTLATQSAVLAELKDLFLREAEPGGLIPISKIREAASIATGVNDSNVLVPSGNVQAATGQIPILGSVTWGSL